jgi:ABC-type phosphate transport system auxiliary subunit
LCPFLAKCHPRLQTGEFQRPVDVSLSEYEQKWLDALELRKELEVLRGNLHKYSLALADIAGIEN